MSEQWVSGVRKCPECGKEFPVLWPTQWAYKRGLPNPTYICSWKCLRAYDKKKGEAKMGAPRVITKEMETEAIRLAISGEDPRPYLKKCGSQNPQNRWTMIRCDLKQTDPETFAKLPRVIGHKRRPNAKQKEPTTLADAMEGMQDAADEFFGKCEDMGLTIDAKNIELQPEKAIEYKVTGIDTEMGSFRYYKRSGYLDWDGIGDNDTVSMNVDEWRQLIRDLPKIMDILGVKE